MRTNSGEENVSIAEPEHDVDSNGAPDRPAPVRHEFCWAKTTTDGKPGISVRDHCLNVGCVAEVLIELLPASVRALLPQGVATLAALHDVGKVSPGFQVKCRPWLDQHGLIERALAEHWNMREPDHAKTVVAEVDSFEQGTDSISDQPVSFGDGKSSGPDQRWFAVRRIAQHSP